MNELDQMELNQIVENPNGVKYYRFNSLNDDKVKSLFTTRIGGVSPDFYGSLNMGCSTGDSKEHVIENCRRVAEVMGISVNQMVAGAQTHTKNIKVISKEDAGKGVTLPRDYSDIDGLITKERGICLTTGHADCNPVLFYDPKQQVVAAIHSGWMGTLLNISAEAVKKMQSEFGSNPSDLKVAIGPALCRDCFEVDVDVAEKFLEAYPYLNSYLKEIQNSEAMNPENEVDQLSNPQDKTGNPPSKEIMIYKRGKKYYIDLKAIILHEITALGVKMEHVEVSHLCTKEHPELFFSHRKTGVKRGVMAAAIMLN